MIVTALITFVFSFCLCFFSIPYLVLIAKKFSIYDKPNEIKKHNDKITYLGGISIVFSFIISFGLTMPESVRKPIFSSPYFIVSICLFFYGLLDDIFDIKPIRKLLIQSILCTLLIYKINLYIPFEYLYQELNSTLSLALTIVILLSIINAFNLIDGADGVAVSLAIITTTLFTIIFIINKDYYFSIVTMALLGSLIGYFFNNKPPAKIFMGDSGSLFLGMMIGTLIIVIIAGSENTKSIPLKERILLSTSTISVAVFDMIRLFIIRIIKGKNPMKGDNHHIHHKLQKIGFSKLKVLTYIILIQLFFTTITLLLKNNDILLVYIFLLLLYIGFIETLNIAKIYMDKFLNYKTHKIYRSVNDKINVYYKKLENQN